MMLDAETNNHRISVRFKLVFLTAFVLFLAITISNIAIYTKGRDILQTQILSALSAVAKSRADQIATIVQQGYDRTALIASRTQLRLILEDLNTAGADIEDSRQQLINILTDAMGSVPAIRNIDMLNRAGIIEASTTPGHIGRNDSGIDWFHQGFRKKYMTILAQQENRVWITFAMPLIHPASERHDVIGVVKVDMVPSHLMAVLSEYTGLGKTGELMLVSEYNAAIVAINPLRHCPDKVLTPLFDPDKSETPNIFKAVKGKTGEMRAPDYRGNDTLMAYVQVPVSDQEWGLIAKIDVDEAFAPMEILQKQSMFFGGVLLLLGILSVVYIGSYITAPIKKLLVGNEKLGHGQLDYRLEVKGDDEISELASSFNTMADKLQQMDMALREKTVVAQTFMDALPCVALLLKTHTREIVALNKTAREAGAQAGGTCFETWPKLNEPCWFCKAPKAWETGLHQIKEVEFLGVFWEAHWVPVTDELYLHYALDITERKRDEERIQYSLKEKEILLKEIHHRVKNNMQVVTSLLNLQASKTGNQLIKNAFWDAQSRVQSMALIHEILYRSENIMDIDLQSYIEKLGSHLIQVFYSRMGQIDIKIDAGEVVIGIDQASPCGLILNELITNALKYAFPPDGHGQIMIRAKYGPDEMIILTIADNGIGIPAEIDPLTVDTLGLRLVTRLVEDQLGGKWFLERRQGTCWTIEWSQTENKI